MATIEDLVRGGARPASAAGVSVGDESILTDRSYAASQPGNNRPHSSLSIPSNGGWSFLTEVAAADQTDPLSRPRPVSSMTMREPRRRRKSTASRPATAAAASVARAPRRGSALTSASNRRPSKNSITSERDQQRRRPSTASSGSNGGSGARRTSTMPMIMEKMPPLTALQTLQRSDTLVSDGKHHFTLLNECTTDRRPRGRSLGKKDGASGGHAGSGSRAHAGARVRELRYTEIEMLVHETGYTKGQIQRAYRTSYPFFTLAHYSHANWQRYLDLDGFEDILRQQLHQTFDQILLKRMFGYFDTTGTGKVHFLDWLRAIRLMTHGSEADQVLYCFHVYDLRDQQYLDDVTVLRLLETQGLVQPELGELKAILVSQLDVDRDRLISRDDFLAGVQQYPLLVQALGACMIRPPLYLCPGPRRPGLLMKPQERRSDATS